MKISKKNLLTIAIIVIVLLLAALFYYLCFYKENRPDYNLAEEGYYCQIARQELKDNQFIDEAPCTEKEGSIDDRTNSVLVTFHLYTPPDWNYENYQMYEIDKNTEKIVGGIAPN
jgi:hypothetical protein